MWPRDLVPISWADRLAARPVSTHIQARAGLYLDKQGVAMTDGGGSLLIERDGRYIGPGHAAVFSEGGRDWFSYHYYDGNREGLPWVEVRRMEWEEGWPVVMEERFNSTAYFGQ